MQNRPFLRCTVLGLIKGAFRYVFSVISHHVSSGSVATYNVRTFHSILIYVCFSNSELDAFLPNNLGKVACSSRTTWLAKCVTIFTDFVVPLHKNIDKKKKRNTDQRRCVKSLIFLYAFYSISTGTEDYSRKNTARMKNDFFSMISSTDQSIDHEY